MSATDAVPRVAVLARPGEACDRIHGALREAGAEVVLVADPLASDPALVREAAPDAILVALDASIEDAIERYDDVLADPAYMVIFEEAEQAAQRAGWDAARWLRHLSAKLHRHGDVLPPGTERDEDFQPTPGPLRAPGPVIDFEQVIVAFTDEAQQHADEVPRDDGVEGMPARGVVEEAPLAWPAAASALALVDDDAADSASEVLASDAPTLVGDSGGPTDAGPSADLEDAGGGLALVASVADDVEADADAPAVGATDAVDPGLAGAIELDAVALETLELDALHFEAVPAAEGDDHAFDPVAFEAASTPGVRATVEDIGGIEEFLAERIAAEPDAEDAAGAVDEASTPGFGSLSLADDDAPIVSLAARDDAAAAPAVDLAGLGSGLSLADPESYGHGPLRGLVLIEAGIGGPDAVRQLLAAMPGEFQRPILVRMRLDGGRYDRLVRQMERATALPVALAEPGQQAQPGHVHFVPPGLGVSEVAAKWTFVDAADFDPAQALLADDSAVLFLSGADAALVERVTGPAWSGGLVAGQAPGDGCYDPQAASAAIAAGAASGTPAELAALLLQRWPVAGSAPDLDPEGMLQP